MTDAVQYARSGQTVVLAREGLVLTEDWDAQRRFTFTGRLMPDVIERVAHRDRMLRAQGFLPLDIPQQTD